MIPKCADTIAAQWKEYYRSLSEDEDHIASIGKLFGIFSRRDAKNEEENND